MRCEQPVSLNERILFMQSIFHNVWTEFRKKEGLRKLLFKAKVHYASWFEAAVADRFEASRRPASNLSATSFEPDSVMEFGFYRAALP